MPSTLYYAMRAKKKILTRKGKTQPRLLKKALSREGKTKRIKEIESDEYFAEGDQGPGLDINLILWRQATGSLDPSLTASYRKGG